MLELVLATGNPGKLLEFQRLFSELMPELSVRLVHGREIGLPDVMEDGPTFMENARIKAVHAARWCGRMCLAEDSGIEVDCLGGEPGVHSHRFSETGDDEDNNDLLLAKLDGVPWQARTARYRSAICVAVPKGIVAEGEGMVEGIITEERRGANGFGYDPLFFSVELGKTMGEASAGEKDSVSHRRRAMEEIARKLRGLGFPKEDA